VGEWRQDSGAAIARSGGAIGEPADSASIVRWTVENTDKDDARPFQDIDRVGDLLVADVLAAAKS
jgi:hypothetical protein